MFVYDESVEFDGQKGVYNVIGSQTAIPLCMEYHQESPDIDGYLCTTYLTPSNDGFIVAIDTFVETQKPYLKINDSDPHPLVQNGKFFVFKNKLIHN